MSRRRVTVHVPPRKLGWIIYAGLAILILVTSTYFAISYIFQPVPPPKGVAGVDTFIANADTNSVLFVYPDNNASHPKLKGVGYPTSVDTGIYYQAIGIVLATSEKPQIETTDTGKYINLTDGTPKSDFRGSIVLLGSPRVNGAVAGYENSGQSPVILDDSNKANYYFKETNGSRLSTSAIAKSVVRLNSSDIFVIEAFRDTYDRPVLIMYGYGFMGTLAAAKFYKSAMLQNLANYTSTHYIVEWADAAEGASHNGFPDSADAYSILAQGTPETFPTRSEAPLQYAMYGYVTALILIVVGVLFAKGWVSIAVERKP